MCLEQISAGRILNPKIAIFDKGDFKRARHCLAWIGGNKNEKI
ncbi:hypothetical protein KIS4809_5257 [Bacillus sp. ZZV12-4809]|nr:hypothetical protein KIS4809_5257 [Bacillus sp. ZZV12-4809]